MKTSILIPVYGVEKYIAECARSLFEQTYEDIEYIFVDDCTPDNSMQILKDILEEYPQRKHRVRFFYNKRNLGSMLVRLVALKKAIGDYIMFVDSDDSLPTDAVEKLTNAINRTGADFIEGDYITKYKGGVTTLSTMSNYTDQTYRRLLLCQNLMHHTLWGKIFKRELFTETDIEFNPAVTNMEDFSIIAQLAFYSHRETINDVVYIYRSEGDSFFYKMDDKKRCRSVMKVNETVMKFYSSHDTEHEYAAALKIGFLNMLQRIKTSGISKQDIKEQCIHRPKGIIPFVMLNLYPYLSRKTLKRIYLIHKFAYRYLLRVLH